MNLELRLFLVALGLMSSAAQAGPPRGSAEEKAEFERHQLPSDKLGKAALQSAGEVTSALAPGERPSLRFMKKGGKLTTQSLPVAPAVPVAAPALVNKEVHPPSDFALEYNLDADAAVTISIIGPDGVPVSELSVPAGQPGGLRGKNRVLAWDGRDALGREAPVGSYQALVIVRPGLGVPLEAAETKVLLLNKAK